MYISDIVNVLQHLHFTNGQILLLLDRGVRDYIVRALRGPLQRRRCEA
jgi:hypothetical protein